MIIPGHSLLARNIVTGLKSATQQVQPCGIDLTLRRVLQWKTAGVIDFDNSHRKTADTVEVAFTETSAGMSSSPQVSHCNGTTKYVHLNPGAYLVEFNEKVDTPLDPMGQIFVRSSLFRSGALVSAGVMDAGYHGAIGGLLQVINPHGLTLYQNAKLAQFVFHTLAEKVTGYSGVHQNKSAM